MHKIKHFLDRLFSWKLMIMMRVFLHSGIHYIHRWPSHMHIQNIATANWKKLFRWNTISLS